MHIFSYPEGHAYVGLGYECNESILRLCMCVQESIAIPQRLTHRGLNWSMRFTRLYPRGLPHGILVFDALGIKQHQRGLGDKAPNATNEMIANAFVQLSDDIHYQKQDKGGSAGWSRRRTLTKNSSYSYCCLIIEIMG